MRVGENPSKEKPSPVKVHFHQVILPIYIPYLEEYYKDSFEVMKLCLNSIFKTCHSQTFITVVNNGSCGKVRDYLISLSEAEKIHELIHTTNIGKLNAILKGVCGHQFKLITIADADTLFLNGWQEASYVIFEKFPKAGVVGLTPQFKMFHNHSANILFETMFSNNLKFESVKNPKALQHFYRSIGWGNYNNNLLQKALVVHSYDASALVGSGHYVATYNARMFKTIPVFLDAMLGRNTEHYLDNLPLLYGLWRLTTTDNFAHHIGNSAEEWMKTKVKHTVITDSKKLSQIKISNPKKISYIEFFIKHKLFFKIFKINVFYQLFLRFKGLPKKMINNYNIQC